MSTISPDLQAHLDSAHTTLAHAWAITRKDGQSFGFTDHDRDLSFDGLTFRPDTGMSALALQQSTGLSVDNTEALGALSDSALSEADILAGRFDDAEITAWRVNWADVSQRALMFRGHIGELRRIDGAFQAEIRGLSAALNKPLGRVYQKPCTAVLGDATCGFDVSTPGYSAEVALIRQEDCRVIWCDPGQGFEADWFEKGRLEVLVGSAQGLWSGIKRDIVEGDARRIELWDPIRADLEAGDMLRLIAGCDKRMQTCRFKFNNLLNFQGFPDLPGEDWIMLSPSAGTNTGGSRR